MFDVNPESHRHHLAELERQIQPRSRPYPNEADRGVFLERIRNAPVALAIAAFILGGFAGGSLL